MWWLLACATTTHVERLPDAPVPMPEAPPDASEAYLQGEQLYRTAACVGCHSPPFDDGQHLGGGRDLPTMFGLFWAPNISPGPQGIGDWTEDDFFRAMRHGRAPDGRRYWPTFPYMTYTRMSDEDLSALWVYLSEQPAVDTPSKDHEMNPPYGAPGMLAAWRTLAFRAGPLEDDPTQSAEWNRGRYLVQAVSYCDQCHTPRGKLGLVQDRRYLAGGANPGKADVHPNLTPSEVGLADWSHADIVHYLKTAEKPDGTVTPPEDIMAEKIHDSFRYHPDEDLEAIATYLESLEPNDFDPATWRVVEQARRKQEQ